MFDGSIIISILVSRGLWGVLIKWCVCVCGCVGVWVCVCPQCLGNFLVYNDKI